MTHQFDNTFRKQGFHLLAGIDEVGRGPLAGPVVAAAVILDPNQLIYKLDDSKKLSEKKRLALVPRIKEKAIAWAVAEASVEEIETMNIVNATFLAMKRALDGLTEKPAYTLVDGRDFPTFLYRGEGEVLKGQPVIKGDAISASIASASILAKVYRDELMVQKGEEFPQYGFENHKGYAARSHIEAIRQHGPSALHRKTFIRKINYNTATQLSLV